MVDFDTGSEDSFGDDDNDLENDTVKLYLSQAKQFQNFIFGSELVSIEDKAKITIWKPPSG